MQEKNRDIILIYEMEIIRLEIKHNCKILKMLQV